MTGSRVTTRVIEAYNTATESENLIHDDTVARKFGFGGGLVPGVDVFGYLTHPAVERWGAAWFRRGAASASFAKPVFDGEQVRVEAEPDDGDELSVRVGGTDGDRRAEGTVRLLADTADAADATPALAVTPRPTVKVPADFASLAPGTALGTLEFGFHADRALEYLDDIRDDLAIYRDEGIAHPAWLLRSANYVLSEHVRLGPWIHVASDVRLHRPVHDGARVSTRARVRESWERSGHDFVALDVEITADGELAMAVDHTAIFRPRQVRAVG